MSEHIREIPYNYTSYSDREIVRRFLSEDVWDDLSVLRSQRKTGRSARLLFDILGDVWVIERNIFLKNDLLKHPKRLKKLRFQQNKRIERIKSSAEDNPRATRVACSTERMLKDFYAWFEDEPKRRRKAKRVFSKCTHRNNVHFDAFTLSHHATDATDWRSHLPFCVLTPDTAEEIPGLIRAIQAQSLVVIPRGGGTGLCGGSVPLSNDTVIINIEKFDKIGQVKIQNIGEKGDVATISAQAGAVTGKVMDASKPHVFATDPTSLWACTIGGNVASNAGGKHAVIWGTCVDNLLSWKMVAADGHWLLVERINHNMGKLHDEDEVVFKVTKTSSLDGSVLSEETMNLAGNIFRREGLGKDVTRKAMGGLPGVQKEGTDGFITEATFILHRAYDVTRTVCCEFFGQRLDDATQALVNIKNQVDAMDAAFLEGFEHFDEKYVKAINYVSKSTRRERPRVVLLIDVSGDDEKAVAQACSDISRLASEGNGEGFVAISEEDRGRFWGDRGRMSAIAKHTRAFKMNEDVVIPLPRLSEYNDYIEFLNIENSISNKVEIIDALATYLSETKQSLDSDNQLIRQELNLEDDVFLAEKLDGCLDIIKQTRLKWCCLCKALKEPASAHPQHFEGIKLLDDDTVFSVIQRADMRISYRDEVENLILDHLRGNETLVNKIKSIHQKVLSGRVVVATHMHAGDGNVHTNIPVNSNDYMMMRKAHHVVEKVMRKAEELGGVISGEHGIGITKLEYLNKDVLAETEAYLKEADPEDLFNRGKLQSGLDLSLTYTPSFNLLEHESVIMEAADLTELSEEISPCLRCGKCKPVCNTHFPRANMLYSPRNKIQASGAIIEAFLYESQTGAGISFEQFEGLQDVASHCTICHKCEAPCPVDIDFGVVTEKMRALLKDKGQARFNIVSKLSLMFLVIQNPDLVKIVREVGIRWSYKGHQLLHKVAKMMGVIKDKPAATRNLDGIQAQIINFVERPLPTLPLKTSRQILGIESRDKNMIPILRDPKKSNGRAVFYFPGCGSERLFSQVGIATQAMLFDLGINVVLPPSYLCCGYPSTASGDHAQGDKITYDNRVLFHRLKNALSYLDFEAVVISCGTCYDQLTKYHLEEVFPGAPLIDIHEYLMTQGVSVDNVEGVQYMYHEPCHNPLKRHGSEVVISSLLNKESVESEECCAEAGTLAAAYPVISGKIRARKEEKMAEASEKLALLGDEQQKILTSCPACLQGLSRLEESSGVEADYIIVELIKQLHGDDWQKKFVKRIKNGGIERVLM